MAAHRNILEAPDQRPSVGLSPSRRATPDPPGEGAIRSGRRSSAWVVPPFHSRREDGTPNRRPGYVVGRAMEGCRLGAGSDRPCKRGEPHDSHGNWRHCRTGVLRPAVRGSWVAPRGNPQPASSWPARGWRRTARRAEVAPALRKGRRTVRLWAGGPQMFRRFPTSPGFRQGYGLKGGALGRGTRFWYTPTGMNERSLSRVVGWNHEGQRR